MATASTQPGSVSGRHLQTRALARIAEQKLLARLLTTPDRAGGPAFRRNLERPLSVADSASAAAPAAVSGNQLRLGSSSFAPAAINSNYDYAENAATAGSNWFSANHWWSYTRLGMTAGYYERADATDLDGNQILFHWQASVYSSNTKAAAAFKDGVSRSSTYTQSGSSCTYIYHVPCWLAVYSNTSGDTEAYEVVQVQQCIGETADTEPSADALANDINQTAANIHVDGESLLAKVCHGGSGTVPPPAVKPVAKLSPGHFHGSCSSFRGTMWGYVENLSTFQGLYWSMLQSDYNGNYPPPTGGSVPGITRGQFSSAQRDMTALRGNVLKAESKIAGTLAASGIRPKDLGKPGAFHWAALKVYSGAYYLDKASNKEFTTAGSGMADYQTAQQSISNSWDALKQLPCK
jgi:hypothetical protein